MHYVRKALVASVAALAIYGIGSGVMPTTAKAAGFFGGQQECSTGKMLIGMAVGGLLGGLVSSRIGDGRGQKITTRLGAALGAVAGSKVACRLDTRSVAHKQVQAELERRQRAEETAARVDEHRREELARVAAAEH